MAYQERLKHIRLLLKNHETTTFLIKVRMHSALCTTTSNNICISFTYNFTRKLNLNYIPLSIIYPIGQIESCHPELLKPIHIYCQPLDRITVYNCNWKAVLIIKPMQYSFKSHVASRSGVGSF